MMDFNADNLVKKMIGEIIRDKGKISSNESIWFQMTKCMFRNHNAVEVLNLVYGALEEEADEQWFENKYSEEEFNEKFVEVATKKKERNVSDGNSITSKIVAKISILDIADRYGLKPLGKNKRVCPFHADSDPSLSLSDDKGLFNCFGCHTSGNIIDFVYLLRERNILEVKI